MSLNYYADFSSFLKSSREKTGITLDSVSSSTRIPVLYLECIERGEFGFASSVLIQGYLRQYAKILGLDEQAVARQYNMILKKIEYVSSDHHLPPPFIEHPHEPVARQIRDTLQRSGKWIRRHAVLMHSQTDESTGEFSTEPMPGWEITSDPLVKTGKTIDDEVARKWLAERRLTNVVTAFCICLLAVSFVFFLSEPTGSGSRTLSGEESNDKQSIPVTAADNKKISVPLRTRWNITPALLTEEEISEKERTRLWLEQESVNIRKNLVSQSHPDGQQLIPVSVHESASFLEENY